jgi:GNAT superfamily N-acetyltransferase
MEPKIVEFEEIHFSSLMVLWQECGLATPGRADTLHDVQQSSGRGGRLWVALSRDKLVGSIWVTDDGRRQYLHHLAVAEGWRQRGLGRRLMQLALSYSDDVERQVKIEVERNTPWLRQFYNEFGFVDLGNYEVIIRRSARG